MKKITLLLIIVFLGATGQAHAGDNGLNGLLFGAGSGAIIGQAIGHNTGGTLIGTAVGSMFGYMIGNEMDKNGVRQYRTVYRTKKSTGLCRDGKSDDTLPQSGIMKSQSLTIVVLPFVVIPGCWPQLMVRRRRSWG